jgi:2-polyprenyl-3-methyl-5-hydroxy-6-metoxy-1,4-benzoquinol methylase
MTKPINDIPDETLNRLRRNCPIPEILDEIVLLSRDKFGWYNRIFIRGLEYPWVVSNIDKMLPGSKILDVGSGVSPLPILLANKGASVTTVDNCELTRNPSLSKIKNWDEWGFFDYSFIDDGIQSFNTSILDLSLDFSFDCIYSISVIEHMPAEERLNFIEKAASLSSSGGQLLVTVDLEPSSNRLCNQDRGKIVEDPDLHGSLTDIESDIRNFYSIEKTEIIRRFSDKAGDAAFIRAKRLK